MTADRVDGRTRSRASATLEVVAVALVTVGAVILVVIGSVPRVGVSPDSTSYVAAAASLARDGTLTDWDGQPLTLFPPGLSILLAPLLRSGLSVDHAALGIDAGSLALLVVLTHRLTLRVTRSHLAATVAATLLAASSAVPRVFTWIWSEPPFTVAVVGALTCAVGVVTRQRLRWRDVAVLGGLVSVATTLRWTGITLVPVAAATPLLIAGLPRARRVAWVLACAAAAGVGLAVVGTRNVLHHAPATGDRPAGGRDLASVLDRSLRVLGDLAVPQVSGALGVALGALVVVGVVASGAVATRRRDPAAVPVVLMVVVYGAVLLWSEVTTPLDPVGPRLLMPVLVPLIVCWVHVLHAAADRGPDPAAASGRGRLVTAVVALTLAAAVVGTNVQAAIVYTQTIAGRGQDLSRTSVLRSPLSTALTGSVCAAGVASSSPWRSYWVSGCRPVTPIPLADRAVPHLGTLADLRTALAEDRVGYLALYADQPAVGLADLAGLGCSYVRVGRYADGELYRTSC